MKSVTRIIAILLSVILIAGTIPVFALAGTPQEIGNAPIDMDSIPRKQFQKAVLNPEDIAKLSPNSNVPGYGYADLILDVLGAVGGDMRCWAVSGLMDSLFGGSGGEAADFLTTTAAIQMQNEILNAIGSVAKLEDFKAIQDRLNAFIAAANEGRETVATTMATLKKYEDNSNPKAPADPKIVESRLSIMSNKELVENANIDSIFNQLHTAVMVPYNVTFNGAPALMDLFDVYRSSMRYTFPWENDGMESMKAYYNAVIREYALIAFIDVLSIDARYKLAETQEMKDWYQEQLNVVVGEIAETSGRLNHINNFYTNEHDYHWFWAPGYSVKIPKRDSYAVECPQDTNREGVKSNYRELIYDYWKKMFTDKGMNEVLDGNGYQAMLNACAQYANYGGRDYQNATFEELITWGNLGIKFNQKSADKFLFKISDVEDNYKWLCNYLIINTRVLARGIDADIKAGTVLPKEDLLQGVDVIELGVYMGAFSKYLQITDNGNLFCLPVIEHPHMIDGNVMNFKPWTSSNSLPRDSGNYYLTTDVTLTDTKDPYQGTEINLCLNGHVIRQSATGKRCMTVHPKSTLNIHDCNGDNCTHEGYVDGSGLWHLGSSLSNVMNITGGVITGSTDSGIYVHSGGCLNMYGGTVAGNKAYNGGAVYHDGVFNMYGGDICYNMASPGKGGGIFTIGNIGMYGGRIHHNAGGSGGGVSLDNDNAVFDMYGGNISNNKGVYGGGVDIDRGTFRMHNGAITNNTATYGGGVFNYRQTIIGGSSVIDNNTNDNLYVQKGWPITIGTGSNGVEAPTKDMRVGVAMQSNTGAFTKECGDYSANFFSDNAKYKVAYNATSKCLELKADSAVRRDDPDPSKPEQGSEPTPTQTVENNNSNNTNANPKTSDESNVTLWFALTILSTMGICACLLFTKRKKDVK